MKKPIGAIISAVLLCMVFCTLSVRAEDAEETEEDEPYLGSVMIDWVELTSSDQYYKNGNGDSLTGTPDDYNAHYDPETGVLTLRNLELHTSFHNGIVASGNITVVLEGENIITLSSSINSTGQYIALKAPSIVIKGTGTLVIDRLRDTNVGYCVYFGISADSLTIESGDIQINYSYAYSVSVDDLTICGGSLTTTGVGRINCANYVQSGGTVYAKHDRTALTIGTSAIITGGELTAVLSLGSGAALKCYENLTLDGCGNSSATVSVGANEVSASKWESDTELDAEKLSKYPYVHIAVEPHNVSMTSGTTPTCVKEGTISYWTCSACKKYYADKFCAQSLSSEELDTPVPATGQHTEVIDPAVSPTWLEPGLTEGSHCSVCGQIMTAQQTVAPTGPAVVSGIETAYDDNIRAVTLTNVPTGMVVALGAYAGGRMVFTDFKTGVADAPISFQLLSGISADSIQAFFLTADWRPVAQAKVVL